MEGLGQTEKLDHVAIEIGHEHNLVHSIKEKMENFSLLHSVCRISEEISEGNQEKYSPSLLSIGPFHHGKNNLNVMEDLKWQYFNTLLNRNPNAETILDTCVKTLKHSEQKARKFYGELVNMESDKFVEIMLVDGCFIIELFLEYSMKNLRRRDDPIFFSTDSKMFWLRCDMILLENQIPFWVLQKLFYIVVIKQCGNMSLMELALCFFRKLLPGDGQIPQDKFGPEIHNLLDLIRQQYLPTMPRTRSTGGQKSLLSGATDLQLAGIRLRRAANEVPLNVRLINRELQIPPFKVNGYTEILFRNLIALERSHHQCSKTITSYAIFMASLIQNVNDARILRSKRILIDGSHEREGEILDLMKKLHVEINVTDFYYGEICRQINDHQKSRRQTRCQLQAMRDINYRRELGVLGFILAIVLLVFLFIAIFFSIVAFLLHHFH
ncbi:Hypothetical predicted protein [Olea europaea subsp. europaea]|uniref:Uncharacterized protein n=2 Tax=Olea europaea subsp. europaea TaxID=158383 RepID=A0A8S0SHB4_OLEEU|nr:Hypothetical predicted protein [Olea europaea subsp. europaea]